MSEEFKCKKCGKKDYAGKYSPKWGTRECDLCWKRRVFGLVHKLIYKRFGEDRKQKVPYYLCNQAFYAKKEKCNRLWKMVTCLNCLKQKPCNIQ